MVSEIQLELALAYHFACLHDKLLAQLGESGIALRLPWLPHIAPVRSAAVSVVYLA